MGNCASLEYTRHGGGISWSSPTKIIHMDGRLQEFDQPIKACHVLTQYPNCILCNSDSMYVGCQVAQATDDEELQLGQIYFLLPLSKSNVVLSLQELCGLALKASAALSQSDTKKQFLDRNGSKFPNNTPIGSVTGGTSYPVQGKV